MKKDLGENLKSSIEGNLHSKLIQLMRSRNPLGVTDQYDQLLVFDNCVDCYVVFLHKLYHKFIGGYLDMVVLMNDEYNVNQVVSLFSLGTLRRRKLLESVVLIFDWENENDAKKVMQQATYAVCYMLSVSFDLVVFDLAWNKFYPNRGKESLEYVLN